MSKNIQIRDVSDETHRILRTRAAEAGMSLSKYLLRELEAIATQPTIAEVLAKARADLRSPGPTTEDIVRAIREGREERERRWSS